MTKANQGDTVKVHYTGKLPDGSVFDSSEDRDPLEFTIGQGQVIPGFEEAVVGMSPGDSKTEIIPADQAYGPRLDENVVEVERSQFPDDMDPEVGMQVQLQRPDGPPVPVTIQDVSEEAVTLDGNHPLAGQELTFEIELVGVE